MGFDREAYRKQIKEAVGFLKKNTGVSPTVGIILGTGLGGLAKEIDRPEIIDYEKIPHFPRSTVESHNGKLILGQIGDKKVVAMQGRFHYYEGYTMQQITFPVRVMGELGVKTLLISNAAGGMNIHFQKGDLMLIDDHINLQGTNPLIGQNLDEYGPRFPDMSEPYSKRLIQLAEEIALEHQIKVQRGVFVAVPGPSLETRAEYRFLRAAGADAVGMSTVPEDIVAVQMGMEVFGISVITDECFPDALEPVDVSEIIAVARYTEPKLTLIMKELIERL
ncbi:MAG TPA: purine-nucleoside phosphorylase [Caldithrix abyssi]|uniref:Purine nucleoside phosphorylase n=1 Tax=Caldithrix abyssi TaxID=187145 RepID=A0A7V4WV20_CALAY|nr:purine-nucleoside phosphorylase [Caldithrix abyssi]